MHTYRNIVHSIGMAITHGKGKSNCCQITVIDLKIQFQVQHFAAPKSNIVIFPVRC